MRRRRQHDDRQHYYRPVVGSPVVRAVLRISGRIGRAEIRVSIYEIEASEPPWGDYGHILVAGMTAHLSRHQGLLQLERTGPFAPPISFPGVSDIIVTDDFRRKYERSGLTGLDFLPVIKRHIVHLEWDQWDLAAEEPAEYPDSGEPEDYILERPFCAETAGSMGDLWEVVPREAAQIERDVPDTRSFHVDLYVVLSTWDGTDWFRGVGYRGNYLSERAKAWLHEVAPGWVDFTPALTR